MCSLTQLCPTLCGPVDGLWPSRLLCPWNFPGKNTGSGCHFLLQEISPTQSLNPCLLCLLHWQVGSLPLRHLGSPTHVFKHGHVLIMLVFSVSITGWFKIEKYLLQFLWKLRNLLNSMCHLKGRKLLLYTKHSKVLLNIPKRF